MTDEDGTASDQALAYAQNQLAWYRSAGKRARRLHYASELGILSASAGTVLVAALHAPAVVTATLAAATLFLTGARTVFTPNDNWVRTSSAVRELEEAVVRYQNLPEAERVGQVREAFLDKTLAICRQENTEWRDVRLKSGAEKAGARPAQQG